MSHQSEERVPDSAGAGRDPAKSAQILPFERPQSELQRAIQLRAHETLERERDREREDRRPKPLKWLVILLLASIPVILTLGAVDGFLRVIQKAMLTYGSAPAASESAGSGAQAGSSEPGEPGVVMLQSYPGDGASSRAAPAGERRDEAARDASETGEPSPASPSGVAQPAPER